MDYGTCTYVPGLCVMDFIVRALPWVIGVAFAGGLIGWFFESECHRRKIRGRSVTNNLAEAYVFEKDAPAPEIEVSEGMRLAGSDVVKAVVAPWFEVTDADPVFAAIYRAMESQRRKEQGE